ncbi:MAG: amidohydrolase family protein [Crocinitomicaceae bacterium]|nr:amidohydrolase family protein [Crocinitomicaceae bacterium]
MKYLFIVAVVFLSFCALSQDKPTNGVAPSITKTYLLKNATIIVSPEKTISKGYLLIENGKIKEVGTVLLKPTQAVEIDCEGKTIVPSFIDLNTEIGIQKPKAREKKGNTVQLNSSKEDFYSWNDAIRPEFSSSGNYQINNAENKKRMLAGFGFALTYLHDGIMSGTGSIITLGTHPTQFSLVFPDISTHFSLSKGSSKQTYPSSQMGSIALMRQTLYDAKWWQKNKKKENINLSLDALVNQLEKPILFETKDVLEIFRGDKIAKEFGFNFAYYGSGNEYQQLNELKKTGATIILPLNYPTAFNVTDPYVNREIPLKELKHWELAPSNPYLLASNGIPICFTFDQLNSEKEFWQALKKAMERGLSAQQALAALTINPAKTVHLDKELGTLDVGKIASFSVFNTNPFETEADLLEVWTYGYPTFLKENNRSKIDGNYNLLVDNKSYSLEISINENKYIGKISNAPKPEFEKVDINVQDSDILLAFKDSINGVKGTILLHGKMNQKVGVFEGEGTNLVGRIVKWNAIKRKTIESTKKENTSVKIDSLYKDKIWFPNMAYGFEELPKQQSFVIKDATVWTNEKDGVLRNATVVVENGKIAYVGTGGYRTPANAIEISGRGLYLTSGIIDEHSHIAISKGVNESGQSNTAEVAIADVIRNNDINIYRQLAGGVTTSQLLHGSANAIGGQAALIKLKWGFSPEEMLVENAPKFIKFALGENVKQSNWGDNQTIRFPQTRMGVEQVFIDAFTRAKAYMEEKSANKRVDLELEVLAEILKKERFITCHSYNQSEILMLMRVAESFGSTVNTFTHVLEGYKIADELVKHGAGASTFADWWAYKYEVLDAIPHNASLMNERGVTVAINSDDAEMGRRLNQEAAKAMKYGGMSEEDAWKMVTLNPAKLLHIDDRMGSIKVGKDADLVLWSDNPLTITAIPEKVIVDGILLFDRRKDIELQLRNEKEKTRIINKMLDAKNNKENRNYQSKDTKLYHCDTLEE